MKRVYSIKEIESIIKSNGYIDLFFYKGYCNYSNQIYTLLQHPKYIDIYLITYKIFDTLIIQFNVELVPSIVRLTTNGISNIYTGKSEINKYIMKQIPQIL